MCKISTLTIKYIVKYPTFIHMDLSGTTGRREISLTLYLHCGVFNAQSLIHCEI
jgi:hypothetical protein